MRLWKRRSEIKKVGLRKDGFGMPTGFRGRVGPLGDPCKSDVDIQACSHIEVIFKSRRPLVHLTWTS